MEIEFRFPERREWGPILVVLLLCALFATAVVWRLKHPQPEEPPRELTQGERTSQALALAGVAAAGNSGTAVYTPMLFALASNVNEGETTNANLHAAE